MNLDHFCSKIRLIGTEPQIKWATTIRKKKLEELKKFQMRHLALAMKPMLNEKTMTKLKCNTSANAAAFIESVCKYAVSSPSAAWWIKHRDDKFLDWLGESVKICTEYFLKTKPFK